MNYIVLDSGVDLTAPLIYMWEIYDLQEKLVGRYIGKANGGDKRPTQHYPRNVNKLRAGKPYKKGKNYRRVHYGRFCRISELRGGGRVNCGAEPRTN